MDYIYAYIICTYPAAAESSIKARKNLLASSPLQRGAFIRKCWNSIMQKMGGHLSMVSADSFVRTVMAVCQIHANVALTLLPSPLDWVYHKASNKITEEMGKMDMKIFGFFLCTLVF
jgi:hypothetical protein